MLKAAVLVLSGNAFGSLVLLIRNLLVARLISVEDYGVAATFAISLSVVEIMSSMGLQQLIVQDDNGDDPEIQAGLQGFHLLRGILSGVIFFVCAPWIAAFLGVPEVTWAYRLLAIAPVVGGFIHFDIYRRNRDMSFLPLIASNAVPAVLSTVLIWPFNALFGDYQVLLYAYLVQHAGVMVVSHLMAERKYRLSLRKTIIGHALKFGWPLLVNNLLLMLVFQGEKLVVGRELGMSSLAILAMGLSLTLTPILVVAQSLQMFFLPQLSRLKADDERFHKLSMAVLQLCIVGGLAFIIVVMLFGAPLVDLMFGEKYAELLPLMTWLALMQAPRLFKQGCSTIALSQGYTSNAMLGNIFRVVSIPLSWYVAATNGDLLTIIWIATAAEILGYLVMMVLLKYRVGLELKSMMVPLLTSAAFVVLIALSTGFDAASSWSATVLWVFLVVLTAACVVSMNDLRLYITNRTAKSA